MSGAEGVRRLRPHLGLALLLLLFVLVYARSLLGDFVVDDVPTIRDNPYIQQSGHFADYFSRSLWANTALEDDSVPMYRPLFHVFHALSFGVWGDHPFGYHAVLLLLHMANICLVYLLVRRIAPLSAAAAVFGAAVFALNPARVESVAWISGIPDPLTTLFILLALFAHRAQVAPAGRLWPYAAALVSFQLALWSKEVALIFPLLVVAHDFIYTRRIRWGISALYAVLAAAYLLTRSAVLGSSGDWSGLDLPSPVRLADFLLGYGELLTFPVDIPFYLSPPQHPVASALGIVGVLALLAAVAFSWRGGSDATKKSLLFSLTWIIAFSWSAMLMALYREGYFSARFLYLPAVGMAILAAVLYDQLSARHASRKKFIAAAGVLLIAFYSALSWKEIGAWHDDGSMYAKIVRDAPEDATGHVGLGQYYFSRGDYVRAEPAFLAALDQQGSRKQRAVAFAALGTMRGMAGDIAQSRGYLEQAVNLDPASSEAWTGLGNLAWMEGRLLDAIPAYEKALAARPNNHEAAMNLASAYEKTGQSWHADALRQRMAAQQR